MCRGKLQFSAALPVTPVQAHLKDSARGDSQYPSTQWKHAAVLPYMCHGINSSSCPSQTKVLSASRQCMKRHEQNSPSVPVLLVKTISVFGRKFLILREWYCQQLAISASYRPKNHPRDQDSLMKTNVWAMHCH
eukprot:scpid91671/ scgid21401/ 